jgi:hypothetical protein
VFLGINASKASAANSVSISSAWLLPCPITEVYGYGIPAGVTSLRRRNVAMKVGHFIPCYWYIVSRSRQSLVRSFFSDQRTPACGGGRE